MVNAVYVRADAAIWRQFRFRLVSIDGVSEFGVLLVTFENVETRERQSEVRFQLESWCMIASPVPYMQMRPSALAA